MKKINLINAKLLISFHQIMVIIRVELPPPLSFLYLIKVLETMVMLFTCREEEKMKKK
jgi:hypothetical protein